MQVALCLRKACNGFKNQLQRYGCVANCSRTQNGVQIQARGRLFKAVLALTLG